MRFKFIGKGLYIFNTTQNQEEILNFRTLKDNRKGVTFGWNLKDIMALIFSCIYSFIHYLYNFNSLNQVMIVSYKTMISPCFNSWLVAQLQSPKVLNKHQLW